MEKIKKRVALQSQNFARNQASTESFVISQLLDKIGILQSSHPLTREQWCLLIKGKEDLDYLTLKKANSTIFRARVKWYEEGEKSSRYFFSLEKAKYNAKTCSKLIVNNTTYTTDDDILHQQKLFYEDLYKVNDEVSFALCNNSQRILSQEAKNSLQRQISIGELDLAVSQLQNNKTPG